MTNRIREVLESWRSTPYRSGQWVKGVGGAVDCIRFGAGVLADLHGVSRPVPNNLPLDVSLHAPDTARAAMRQLLREYPELEAVEPEDDGTWVVEPLDFVATGPSNGGPGHLVLVGPAPNTCWEATPPCVTQISSQLCPRTQRVFAVYRSTRRVEWLN